MGLPARARSRSTSKGLLTSWRRSPTPDYSSSIAIRSRSYTKRCSRAWPRLGTWIAEQRADLLAHQELRGAAERWNEDGRSEADLYRGLRLDAAVELAGRDRLPVRETEFVDAGLALRNRESSETRRRTRRLRTLVGATSILAVIALLVGVVAIGQRNDAQDSQDAAEASTRAAQIEALVGRAASMASSAAVSRCVSRSEAARPTSASICAARGSLGRIL